ncbi:hypothetical protein D3C72_2483290 [compost metagenome]
MLELATDCTGQLFLQMHAQFALAIELRQPRDLPRIGIDEAHADAHMAVLDADAALQAVR